MPEFDNHPGTPPAARSTFVPVMPARGGEFVLVQPGLTQRGVPDLILFNDSRTGTTLVRDVNATPVSGQRVLESLVRCHSACREFRRGQLLEQRKATRDGMEGAMGILVEKIQHGWGYDPAGRWHQETAEVVPVREESDPDRDGSGTMRGLLSCAIHWLLIGAAAVLWWTGNH